MKNRVVHSLISLTLIFFVALFSLTSSACSYFLTEEDVIPDKLGEAEGFWLYHGNIRSLSDGTEKTELLTLTVIDGIEYKSDEFEILDTAYATDIKEIFYVLSIDGSVYSYHYNYKSGKSGYLFPLNSAHVQIEVSESFVLFTSSEDGMLLNRDLTVIGDYFIGYHIADDIVSKWDAESNAMIYFDGNELKKFHSHISQVRPTVCGIYMYDIYGKVSVNTRTGVETSLDNLAEYSGHPKLYITDNIIYALLTKNSYEYSLFSLADGKATLLYDFGEHQYSHGVEMNKLKFKVSGKRYNNYYLYDLESGKMKKISSTAYNKEEEIRLRPTEIYGYTFYVTYKNYGGSFIGALVPQNTCYYLNREKDGKVEIMQYHLKDYDTDFTASDFYEDICNF